MSSSVSKSQSYSSFLSLKSDYEVLEDDCETGQETTYSKPNALSRVVSTVKSITSTAQQINKKYTPLQVFKSTKCKTD
ncbi:DgyrCDS12165 [Dimorphilus gyrociliatus]|uniref:DgyrCDS12165 n=1 Tax=Dimorphilus gyrociliatus TaxID=2664684 RepID=A0A7I8W5L6_9ANNE|nr:DgyrCDS12165 [Dimorphilus gyrociliatus]